MQPPPLPEGATASFQIPRGILLRIWLRRTLLQPGLLASHAALVVIAAICFVIREGMEYLGLVLLMMCLTKPFSVYRAMGKAIDNNSQLTDPKTLEFSPTRLVVTGPNWKSELPWTTFCGFSEDAAYFYLHLSSDGLASVVPKVAFAPDQQQRFRECAKARNA